MSEETIEAKGRRVEYQVLRGEITHADRTCLAILGLLLAVSGTILGLTVEVASAELVVLLSPLWLVGWCYISEKRFMIRRTSYYLRREIEAQEHGLGWQRWLGRTRKELNKYFPRFDPYLLETFLALVVMITVPIYLSLGNGQAGLRTQLWLCISIAVVFLLLILWTIPKYLRHHDLFDDKAGTAT